MGPKVPTDFTVDVTDEGGVFRLRCAGELDIAAAPLVQDALQALVEQQPREVMLDWTGLTFMDSSGIRILFQTLALCRNKNIDLTWALGDTARKTLDRVGIHDALLRDYSAGTGSGPTYDS
jgi:anti-anti-sigma factor